MWNGLGVDPTQWESLKSVIRVHFRGSGSAQLNTPMLFCRVLLVMVNHLPLGPKPHSWPEVITVSSLISQMPSLTFLTGILSLGVPAGEEMQAIGSMLVRSITTPTANMRSVTSERGWNGWCTQLSEPVRLRTASPGSWPV